LQVALGPIAIDCCFASLRLVAYNVDSRMSTEFLPPPAPVSLVCRAVLSVHSLAIWATASSLTFATLTHWPCLIIAAGDRALSDKYITSIVSSEFSIASQVAHNNCMDIPNLSTIFV